jgi:hypothetical protein
MSSNHLIPSPLDAGAPKGRGPHHRVGAMSRESDDSSSGDAMTTSWGTPMHHYQAHRPSCRRSASAKGCRRRAQGRRRWGGAKPSHRRALAECGVSTWGACATVPLAQP